MVSVVVLGGCSEPSEPEGDDAAGESGDALSASEACEAALDEPPECEPPFGLQVLVGGDPPEVVGVDEDDSVVELDGALFVPPSDQPQTLGDQVFANEACFIGCVFTPSGDSGTCVVFLEGGQLIAPAETVEDCEALRDADR